MQARAAFIPIELEVSWSTSSEKGDEAQRQLIWIRIRAIQVCPISVPINCFPLQITSVGIQQWITGQNGLPVTDCTRGVWHVRCGSAHSMMLGTIWCLWIATNALNVIGDRIEILPNEIQYFRRWEQPDFLVFLFNSNYMALIGQLWYGATRWYNYLGLHLVHPPAQGGRGLHDALEEANNMTML